MLDTTRAPPSDPVLDGKWIPDILLAVIFGYEFLHIIAIFLFVSLIVACVILISLVVLIQRKNLWIPRCAKPQLVFGFSYLIISTLAIAMIAFFAQYLKAGKDFFQPCFLGVSLILLFVCTSVIIRLVVYIQLRKFRPELRGLRFSLVAFKRPPNSLVEPKGRSDKPVILRHFSFSTHSATPKSLPPPELASDSTTQSAPVEIHSSSDYLSSPGHKEFEQPLLITDIAADYLSARPAPAISFDQLFQARSTDTDEISINSNVSGNTKSLASPNTRCSYLSMASYHGCPEPPPPPRRETRDYVESVKYEELTDQSRKQNLSEPSNAEASSPGVECTLRLDQQARLAEFKVTVSVEALNLACDKSAHRPRQ